MTRFQLIGAWGGGKGQLNGIITAAAAAAAAAAEGVTAGENLKTQPKSVMKSMYEKCEKGTGRPGGAARCIV